MSEARSLRPRRMFWRIYVYGLLMLVGAFVVLVVGSQLLIRVWPGYGNELYREGQTLAERWRSNPSGLTTALEEFSQRSGWKATFYDFEGGILTSTAHPPLPVLSAEEQEQLHAAPAWFDREDGGTHYAVPMWRGRTVVGYLLFDATGMSLIRYSVLAVSILLVLLALAGLALPMARALAAPLERLTGVVAQFGQGTLSARAHLKGRDEVATLGRSFDEMAERLEALIRGQKELLANVSHELRTPLARLGVTLDLVEEGRPEELAGRLPELRRDIGELQELVDGVLQMARLDLAENQAGQPGPRLQRVPLAPGALLDGLAERFRRTHPETPLRLEVAPGLPMLEADPVLLRRAVQNLLDNARKYSEPGSPVTLRGHAADDHVLLEVEDRGMGINAADLPLLSQPFFRTDRSRARNTGGVGLGLTLVRRIVEAHQGRFSIHGVPEGGTRVTLLLPHAVEAPRAA
ncbi:ATP-binding protein [Myxococcus stipitatus]|uniref:HAMP domain-containing sensor histidine kinase n=1 Tax=Myxococcus stipitatus TaxID=83455 RepID=UPI001F3E4931|nr:ATP-binding protein [Myxococcus stipitatus]MCE9669776.1 ATP-binding protein [Myxococcus stipitatus]